MRIPYRYKVKDAIARVILGRPWRVRHRKLLLCRPRGGLNDILCQIHRCRIYSLFHDRDLWVDTRRSGWHDCMSHWFRTDGHFIFGWPPQALSGRSCLPACLLGRLDTYEAVYSRTINNFVDRQMQEPLSFDFSCSHPEEILVHEQCGGGLDAIKALRHLRLLPELQAKIRRLLGELGTYEAIHIRNTDLTTDYVSFFRTIQVLPSHKVIVCTDDHRCLAYAREFWKDRLIVVHGVPDTGGRPLHFTNALDRHETNLHTLLDLMILASATVLHGCRTSQGRESGFSLLARSLRANPRVMRHLLNG